MPDFINENPRFLFSDFRLVVRKNKFAKVKLFYAFSLAKGNKTWYIYKRSS